MKNEKNEVDLFIKSRYHRNGGRFRWKAGFAKMPKVLFLNDSN
jgi:hypothetical protein